MTTIWSSKSWPARPLRDWRKAFLQFPSPPQLTRTSLTYFTHKCLHVYVCLVNGLLTTADTLLVFRATSSPGPYSRRFSKWRIVGRSLLPTIRHFENRRGEGPEDGVGIHECCYRAFSPAWRHASHIGEMMVMVFQTNPVRVELFSYVNTFFCSNSLHDWWPGEWQLFLVYRYVKTHPQKVQSYSSTFIAIFDKLLHALRRKITWGRNRNEMRSL